MCTYVYLVNNIMTTGGHWLHFSKVMMGLGKLIDDAIIIRNLVTTSSKFYQFNDIYTEIHVPYSS